jgi:imidazolonepropionase-like amidohydrolase
VREGWEDALPALEASASRDAVDAATRAVLSISVEPRGPTAIIRGRLVDGTGARAIPDAVLVFQGDKILAVGPRGKVKIANGTRFMDAKGRTILPALWDFDARVGTFEDAALLLAQGVETAYVGGDLERAILVRNAAGPQSPAPIPSLKLVGQLSAGAPAPTCGGTCDALVLDGAADDEERAEAQKAGLPVFARVAAGAAAFDGLRAFVASSASSPDAVRDARKSGTPLVAGSAGSTLARAAEVLAASGLTPVQVVRALTSASARAAGEPDRTGTLAAGQRANMLLVEGDASRSIRALRKPAVVIVRGRAMNPDILKDRLGIK